MLEVSNIKVYDLQESVIACRNAMRTEIPEYTEKEFQESLPRAIKLAQAKDGSGHKTFLSGIKVAFDIKYPNYISPELQRYHFLDIVTSASKMHKLVAMDMDKCFNKYVLDCQKGIMKSLVNAYNKEPNYENFMFVLSNCPLGIELFMRCSTNYLQLRTIYQQRKNHRLTEDWVEGFCNKFIKKLPYAKEFITLEG